MTARATVMLFDIDGTLLTARGAGRRAMEHGFGAVTGRDDGLARIQFAGMTDRAIVREGLRAIAGPDDEATVTRVLEVYLQRLPIELARSDPQALPGAVAMVDAVRSWSRVAVGLGTGNIEPGARAKLHAVGLRERFGFGGFGSDHEQRDALLRIGAQRGAAALGVALPDCRVIVIGDTPRDIAAAHAIGARCLAVATSYFDAPTLREAGADLAVDDLRAEGALQWLRAQVDGQGTDGPQ